MYAVLEREREREREREAATLLPIIEGSVLSGTSVMSGLWTAYGGMQVMVYTHLSINRTYEFVDTVTGVATQDVENSWKNVNYRNKKQYGTHRTMLESYLCDCIWQK